MLKLMRRFTKETKKKIAQKVHVFQNVIQKFFKISIINYSTYL